MKSSLFYIILALCACLYPAASISRWFTSSYYDVRATLRRYARCENSLAPLKRQGVSDTEYLVDQIRLFLDQANYDNEQLANITAFMGSICRSGDDNDYPVSINIDVKRYYGTKSKAARCKGIDRTMDSMYGVFKRAALNKSEPLDFSSIQFVSDFDTTPMKNNFDNTTTIRNNTDGATMKNSTDSTNIGNNFDNSTTIKNNIDNLNITTIKNNTDTFDPTIGRYYNLTDLINTIWISSDFPLDQTCNITRKIIEYVQLRTSNSTAQDRSQTIAQSPQGYFGNLLDFIDRLLDPILGLQKRFYWEGSNRVEVIYIGIGNGLGQLRQELSKATKSSRDLFSNVFNYSTGSSNSTALSSNSTAQTGRSLLASNSTANNNQMVNQIGGLFENLTNLTIPLSIQPTNASAAINNSDKTVYSQ